MVAVVIAAAALIGIRYGSFAAAAPIRTATSARPPLWLTGKLRIEQPWVQQFSWPNREWTFAPLGYRPLGADGTIVPTYAPGLPMLMAVFQAVVGANGPFLRRAGPRRARGLVHLLAGQGSH